MLIENDPECAIIGEAANRAAVLEAARLQPDIIILELDLGSESALDFLPELLDTAEGARVLILTGAIDPELHCRAVRLGARGVVQKVEEPDILLTAIKKVHAGEAWLSPSIITNILKKMSPRREPRPVDPEAAKIGKLTARERSVISLIGKGLKNKQLAGCLFISEPTVRRYLGTIFDKLKVADRLELAVYAFRHGLAKLPSKPLMQETSTAKDWMQL